MSSLNLKEFSSAIQPLRGVLPQYGTEAASYPILFVQLGRFGDICNVLPIAHALTRAGYAVDFLVAEEFAPILASASYVRPRLFRGNFTEHDRALREHAGDYETVISTQVWGEGISIQRLEASYNRESWRVCGASEYFSHPEFRLNFDRRSEEREAALYKRLGGSSSPSIAVAVTGGVTAPFAGGQAVLSALKSSFSPKIAVLDLCSVHAEQIIDFLGVYDRSALLVCSDTVHLHLSDASTVPLFGFLNSVDGVPWGTSQVRSPNLIGSVLYRDVALGIPKLLDAIANRIGARADKPHLSE